MQRRGSFFPVFLIFLILAGGIFFLSHKGLLTGITGLFESATVPLQRFTFGIFQKSGQSEEEKLRAENAKLLTLLAKQKELEKENKALHDQFQTTKPASRQLLPALILGTHDQTIVLDKGARDGITVGNVVVFQDNVIGKVLKASARVSVVGLVTHPQTSFTATTVKTETLGVLKGTGAQALRLENVVLSDKLEKDDLVITKGDVDAQGKGYPPGLVVGKIVSVNKKASDLFQVAEVKSLVDVEKLRRVFIIVRN